jgi:hypothetical protein
VKSKAGDAVVQEAFALDQKPKPPRDTSVAQEGDDGDRVGGGDQRSEGQRRRFLSVGSG